MNTQEVVNCRHGIMFTAPVSKGMHTSHRISCPVDCIHAPKENSYVGKRRRTNP
jgi:hypothetical protein